MFKEISEFKQHTTRNEVIETIHHILHSYDISPASRKFLSWFKGLHFRKGTEGTTIMNNETIASSMNVSITTVERAIRELKKLGLIMVHRRHRKTNGLQTTSIKSLMKVNMKDKVKDNHEPETLDAPTVEAVKIEKDVSSFIEKPLSNTNNLSNTVFNKKKPLKLSKVFNTTLKFFSKKGQAFSLEAKHQLNEVVVSFVTKAMNEGLIDGMIDIQDVIGASIDAFVDRYKNNFTCITNFGYFYGVLKNKFEQWIEENRPTYQLSGVYYNWLEEGQAPEEEVVEEVIPPNPFEEKYKGYNFGF